MGLGGISIGELLIVLFIVVLLFGTKRLGSLGSDLGSAIRGFRKAMQSEEGDAEVKHSERISEQPRSKDEVIDGEAHRSGEKH